MSYLEIARHLPLRRILSERGPYLDRYTLASKIVPYEERVNDDIAGKFRFQSGTWVCVYCGDTGMMPEGIPCGTCQSFVYLHHFLASDSSTELHDHPWDARVTILEGSYIEHRDPQTMLIRHDETDEQMRQLVKAHQLDGAIRRAGDTFELKSTTKHRVELCPSDTCVCGHAQSVHTKFGRLAGMCGGCISKPPAPYKTGCDKYQHDGSPADVWTLCEVGPRLKSWGFTDIATGRYTQWREALKARGLL